jgi:hypothetical protein
MYILSVHNVNSFIKTVTFNQVFSMSLFCTQYNVCDKYFLICLTFHKIVFVYVQMSLCTCNITSEFFFRRLFQPIQGTGLLFSSAIIFTDGRTPRTSDQLVARPLPKHRTTLTQNKRIHIPNIHALSEIRTHDPSVRASEGSPCFRRAATVTGLQRSTAHKFNTDTRNCIKISDVQMGCSCIACS